MIIKTIEFHYGKELISEIYQGEKKLYEMNEYIKTDVGNIILVNKSTLEKSSVSINKLSRYSPNEYEPIGVVVIPTEHDVYGTGECGIMSLKSPSLKTPDVGSVYNEAMCFGGYGIETGLPYFNQFVYIGTNNDWYEPGVYDDDKYLSTYLPSDQLSFGKKLKNPNGDKFSSYYYQDSDPHAPSPYKSDWTRNLDYIFGEKNPLSDFNGKSNTELLCSKSITQENWKTDETIQNNFEENVSHYPAACACWRYSTIGTEQGDWYLPSCGEFGYVLLCYSIINDSIKELQKWSGKNYCLLTTNGFLTSTEFSKDCERMILLNNGKVSAYNFKKSGAYAKMFTRGKHKIIRK